MFNKPFGKILLPIWGEKTDMEPLPWSIPNKEKLWSYNEHLDPEALH